MNGQTFTIGELARRVTGGNERAIRQLLNDAGAGRPLPAWEGLAGLSR